MRATAVLLVILAAVLAAVLRPGVVAVVAVEGEHYRAGQSVAVKLHNDSREPLGYNVCSWTLERRGDVGWRPAPHEDARVCTMELHNLAAGEMARVRFPLTPTRRTLSPTRRAPWHAVG